MTGVVLKLVPPSSKPDVKCEEILKDALEHGMSTVLVFGYDKDGEFYAKSSTGDGGDVIYLCELLKHKLLSGEFVE